MTEALSSLYERVRRETALRFPGQEDGLVYSCGQAEGCTAVLIGEAPGEQEVKMKRPFSGQAGKNLDEFLLLSGIEREKLFITNTVKLRPTETGPTGRLRSFTVLVMNSSFIKRRREKCTCSMRFMM